MRRHCGEGGGGRPREGVACLGSQWWWRREDCQPALSVSTAATRAVNCIPGAGQGALWSLILAGFSLKSQPYARNYSSRMKDPRLGLSTSLLSIYDAYRLVAVRITAGRCSRKTTVAFSLEHFCQTYSTCQALGSKPQKPALRESKELGSNLRSTSS